MKIRQWVNPDRWSTGSSNTLPVHYFVLHILYNKLKKLIVNVTEYSNFIVQNEITKIITKSYMDKTKQVT